MSEQLANQLEELLSLTPCTVDVRQQFVNRIAQGNLTQEENAEQHFCVYFLPFNPDTGDVFLVHHKKSGLWISPGGHVDLGETLDQALAREVSEELGFTVDASQVERPFLLTVTQIKSIHGHSVDELPADAPYACRQHYDVWFLVPTDGSNFAIDMEEFHETRWLTIAAALELVEDGNNREALKTIKHRLKL